MLGTPEKKRWFLTQALSMLYNWYNPGLGYLSGVQLITKSILTTWDSAGFTQ